MLVAKDFRHKAWNSLAGKWGTMVIAAIVMSLILGACGGLAVIGIGAIAAIIIEGPLSLGYTAMSMRVVRGNKVGLENLFDGFKNFARSFLLVFVNSIYISLWALLFIVPGIIKSYSYSMSLYILADNPDISSSEARAKSIEMMKGNKWRLFCLHMSFIGWILLSILTLGILLLWIEPYMQTAQAAFYQSLLPEPVAHAEPESQEVSAAEEAQTPAEEPKAESDNQ